MHCNSRFWQLGAVRPGILTVYAGGTAARMLPCRHRLSASCGAPTIPQNYVGYSLPYEQERKPCGARLFACIPPPRPPEPPLHNAPPSAPTGWREAPPGSLELSLHFPASHHRAPWAAPIARMRRARAGFQSAARYSKSMLRPPHRGCKRKRRPNRRLWRGKCGKG